MSSTAERLVSMTRWFNTDEPSPIGRIIYGGYARHRGIPVDEMRVLGTYGLILLLEGQGRFLDAAHRSFPVAAGSYLLLFPEMPHSYGPQPGGEWAEFFLHFEGPAFDCWRTHGMVRPQSPVGQCRNVAQTARELETLVRGPRLEGAGESTGRICQLLALLAQLGAPHGTAAGSEAAEIAAVPRAAWLRRTCDMLADDLNEPLDCERLASVLGMSYSTLRHRFKREMGQSLGSYRTQRRLAAAASLLVGTELSQRDIARRTGFGDESQFSRRFRQVMGCTPREYRSRQPGLKAESFPG